MRSKTMRSKTGRLNTGCIWALLTALTICAGTPPARAGTLVSFTFTNYGTFQVDLFDDLTPVSVANFLHYTNANQFDNTMLHRVDSGLGVIQGGGFTPAGAAITPLNPAIILEYSRANTRGTIALARTGDVNTTTATSGWFINTHDNSTTLGAANAGGYAVFGWVMGTGMTVVDALAATPTFAYSSPFGQIPLQNFTQADFTAHNDPLPHAVVLSDVSLVKTHAAFQNPVVTTDVDNSGSTSAIDALRVINDLIAHQSHAVTGPFSGTDYLDVTGDGTISALDALRVINELLLPSFSASPQASPLISVGPMSVVPEPSSLALAAVASLALSGYAVRRRRRASVTRRRP